MSRFREIIKIINERKEYFQGRYDQARKNPDNEYFAEIFKDEVETCELAIRKLLYEPIRKDQFEGMIIQDYFCNGFFGSSTYDLEGAVIIESGTNYITVRKENGRLDTAYFEDGWQDSMSELIYEWCNKKTQEW